MLLLPQGVPKISRLRTAQSWCCQHSVNGSAGRQPLPRQDPRPRRTGHGHPEDLATPAQAPVQHHPHHRTRPSRPHPPPQRLTLRLGKAHSFDQPGTVVVIGADRAVCGVSDDPRRPCSDAPTLRSAVAWWPRRLPPCVSSSPAARWTT
jgi:hypothetical protein